MFAVLFTCDFNLTALLLSLTGINKNNSIYFALISSLACFVSALCGYAYITYYSPLYQLPSGIILNSDSECIVYRRTFGPSWFAVWLSGKNALASINVVVLSQTRLVLVTDGRTAVDDNFSTGRGDRPMRGLI